MILFKKTFLLLTIFLAISSCQKKTINVSEREYKKNKRHGFWVLKNKKAIRYNEKVAKPRRNREIARLVKENKQTERRNAKKRKKYSQNQSYLKTFDHH